MSEELVDNHALLLTFSLDERNEDNKTFYLKLYETLF